MIEEGKEAKPAQRSSPEAGQGGVWSQEGATGSRLGLDTIRSRLLVAFVMMTLLSVTVVTAGAVVLGWQSGQQRVINQLESVATLKEAEIGTWVDNLQTGLRTILIAEEDMQQARLLVQESFDAAGYQQDYRQLQEHFGTWMAQSGQFEELFLLNSEGRVVLSTDAAEESKFYNNQIFFQRGLEGAYVQPPLYSVSLDKVSVIAAQPVVALPGEPVGVLAGRASPATLNDIMQERAGLGETGETYLVGLNHALLTPLRSGEQDVYVRTEGANAALGENVNGSGVYANSAEKSVLGVYRWLPDLQVALLAEQEQSEALSPLRLILLVNVGVAAAAVLLAVVASLFVTRSIAHPIAELAETAERIAAGDLGLVAKAERRDEMGALARAFNSMTAQLRGLIDTLEQRVAERTRELEQRSIQLQAAAQVASEATAIRDVDLLLGEVVDLISKRFGFYHAGLFLVDEASHYAILRAASSEGGQRMLTRGHRLRVGKEGVVGYVAGRGEPRIALDVGVDAQYFDNPDLPLTRSEVALPLIVHGQVIGVLDVQSTEEAAFDQDDVVILQTMADQVAVALENARLLVQAEERLGETQMLLGQQSQAGWAQTVKERPAWGYIFDGVDVLSREEDRQAQVTADLKVPVRVRGEPIGRLSLSLGERLSTAEDKLLVQAVADQIGQALESARLYQETQRRAARERRTAEITARVRASTDVDTILRTALQELGRTLGASEGMIWLESDDGAEATPAISSQ